MCSLKKFFTTKIELRMLTDNKVIRGARSLIPDYKMILRIASAGSLTIAGTSGAYGWFHSLADPPIFRFLGHFFFGFLWSIAVWPVAGIICLVRLSCVPIELPDNNSGEEANWPAYSSKIANYAKWTFLAMVAIDLLCMNLSINGLASAFQCSIASGPNWLFFRGWPFSPFMFCYSNLSGWYPEKGTMTWPFLLDGLFAFCVFMSAEWLYDVAFKVFFRSALAKT